MYSINNGTAKQLFIATTDMLQRSTMLMYFFFQEGLLRFFFFIFNRYCNRMLCNIKIVFLLNSTAELQL